MIYTSRLEVRLTAALRDEVTRVAVAEERPLATVVRRALRAYIESGGARAEDPGRPPKAVTGGPHGAG